MFFRVARRAFCASCWKSRGLGRFLISQGNLAPRASDSGNERQVLALILKSASGQCQKRLPVLKTSFGFDDAVQILWCRNRPGYCNNGQRSTKSAIAGGFAALFRRIIPLVVICKAS